MAHTQRVHLERTLIEGYTSLVNQLSVFPGKKILVLFSRGLRFDRENAVYLEQFEAAAMRGRVTLHAIDVRGLVAMVRGGAVSDSFEKLSRRPPTAPSAVWACRRSSTPLSPTNPSVPKTCGSASRA